MARVNEIDKLVQKEVERAIRGKVYYQYYTQHKRDITVVQFQYGRIACSMTIRMIATGNKNVVPEAVCGIEVRGGITHSLVTNHHDVDHHDKNDVNRPSHESSMGEPRNGDRTRGMIFEERHLDNGPFR
jgi:hypothetical protein